MKFKSFLFLLIVCSCQSDDHEPLPDKDEKASHPNSKSNDSLQNLTSEQKQLKKEIKVIEEKLEERDSLIKEVLKLEIEEVE